jgi:hypothetical protein
LYNLGELGEEDRMKSRKDFGQAMANLSAVKAIKSGVSWTIARGLA